MEWTGTRFSPTNNLVWGTWMWMSGLRLGPNWIVPLLDGLEHVTPGVATACRDACLVVGTRFLSTCNRRAGIPLYGGL